MKEILKYLFKTKLRGTISTIAIFIVLILIIYKFFYGAIFESYTGVTNGKLTYESSKKITDAEFEKIASEITFNNRLSKALVLTTSEINEFAKKTKIEMLMNTRSFGNESEYSHIKYFREAGIRQYNGPSTCLKCHENIKVHTNNGEEKSVNTMDDVLGSVHFMFQRTAPGFTTYGYDGREVNAEGTRPIPVGKIDRACGIPGSFSWTGWAVLVKSKPKNKNGETEMRSEGCGQCHIGGNYQPATEKMMPIGDIPEETKEGIDCLICHSQSYDMNYKYVLKDDNGTRWNQDRTMKAAMTVTRTKSSNCLNCHQHNMGGDLYPNNYASHKPGYENKRILHAGAKRGNAFSPETDVHAAANINCTDCHVPEGHKIPRGSKGTDLVANDLPGVKVECENCHTSAPHVKSKDRVILNGHISRIACETCHIIKLEDKNVVLRDWVNPTWNEEEGLWEPTDVYRTGETGRGFTFLWFNGNGTFLANALGNNPDKSILYNPLMEQMTHLDDSTVRKAIMPVLIELVKKYNIDPEKYIKEVTNTLSQLPPEMIEKRKKVIEDNLRNIMNKGDSKIYPFKLFNAYMYEDMSNQGPFGAMILPFDYSVYYETGNTKNAVIAAIKNPIVKRMYELPFKLYMMDEFMYYFGVDGWKTEYPLNDNGELRNVEPHWMRQMGTLMVNHGIQKEGRECVQCHTSNGIINFKMLGYSPERIKDLENLKELEYLGKK